MKTNNVWVVFFVLVKDYWGHPGPTFPYLKHRVMYNDCRLACKCDLDEEEASTNNCVHRMHKNNYFQIRCSPMYDVLRAFNASFYFLSNAC